MSSAGPLLDRLEELPRTVAHHDTHGKNVFSETTQDGRRTVAIDWSDLGTAPVGQDLGHFVALNLFLRVVPPSDAAEHERTATDAYLEGLRAFGWRGDEDDVRFAALTTASVQMLSFAACHIAWLCPDFGEVDRWPEEQAEKQFSDVDTIMDSWCEVVRFLRCWESGRCVGLVAMRAFHGNGDDDARVLAPGALHVSEGWQSLSQRLEAALPPRGRRVVPAPHRGMNGRQGRAATRRIDALIAAMRVR